jgi:hypothetical protein
MLLAKNRAGRFLKNLIPGVGFLKIQHFSGVALDKPIVVSLRRAWLRKLARRPGSQRRPRPQSPHGTVAYVAGKPLFYPFSLASPPANASIRSADEAQDLSLYFAHRRQAICSTYPVLHF